MSFYLSAVLLGLGFSALAMGIFISMRIFNIPDITTDGSFTLGGAITAVMISDGYSPWASMFIVFTAGAIAGICTGLIHTKLKVNALLAGILVMTALYSINLAIMGRSTIPLIDSASIFTFAQISLSSSQAQFLVLLALSLLIWLILSLLLRTDFGLAMRATGSNEQMIRSLGLNPQTMKIAGIALANGLIAISGFLITQIQGFADINMGIGIVILGLGSVMIGEMMVKIFNSKSISLNLVGIISGSILFRCILAFALTIGIDPLYLKLVVALFVLVVISIPNLKKST